MECVDCFLSSHIFMILIMMIIMIIATWIAIPNCRYLQCHHWWPSYHKMPATASRFDTRCLPQPVARPSSAAGCQPRKTTLTVGAPWQSAMNHFGARALESNPEQDSKSASQKMHFWTQNDLKTLGVRESWNPGFRAQKLQNFNNTIK